METSNFSTKLHADHIQDSRLSASCWLEMMLLPKKRPEPLRLFQSRRTWTVVGAARSQPMTQRFVAVIRAGAGIDDESHTSIPNREMQRIEMSVGCRLQISKRRQVPAQEPKAGFKDGDAAIWKIAP